MRRIARSKMSLNKRRRVEVKLRMTKQKRRSRGSLRLFVFLQVEGDLAHWRWLTGMWTRMKTRNIGPYLKGTSLYLQSPQSAS